MAIDFDRDSLYAEVSATPITSLAKKYGLSDVGLRKICVALDIPLPGPGHWAKIAAGKPSPVPPLHATAGRTQYRFLPAEAPSMIALASADWLDARISFENDPTNKITVSEMLDAPTGLVARAKKVSDKLVAELERSREEILAPRKTQKAWTMPTFTTGAYWPTYADKGFVELPEDILPTRVSTQCLDRSLRIWDALLKAARVRGLSGSIESRRLRLTAHGHFAELRIAERIEKVVGSLKGLSDVDFMMKRHITNVPTGELRIFVGEKKFADTDGAPLERRLNSVLAEVFKTIDRAEVRQQENVVWRQRHDAEKALVAVRAAEAVEVQKRAAEERAKEAILESEATAWTRANAIRAYASAVSQAAPTPLPERVGDWIAWASSVAERIDPLPARAGLVETAHKPTEEHHLRSPHGFVLPE
jgi:hypothetical protein